MRNAEFTKSLYLRKSQNLANGENLDAGSVMGLPIDNDGYTYGYVFFRQQQDSTLRRGYFQKALVLQSPHSWPGLFLYVVSQVGPKIMDAQSNDQIRSLLEMSCREISDWSSPPSSWSSEQLFHSIEIPLTLFKNEINVSFPPTDHFPQLYETKSKGRQLVTCNPGKFYQIFCRSLDVLWPCWELMALGEPILVMSDSPTACSEVVQSLVELLKPMPFGGDYRPYFTIQDTDFSSLTGRGGCSTSAIVLGITNQVFSKVLGNWPHVMHTGKPRSITQIDS